MNDIKKGFNRKGQQEGLGLGTILALIVGVVALVVIVVGTTMGFGQFFSLFKLAPNDLTKMSAACKTYSENDALKVSYCQFNEGTIEGKKGWFNCVYIREAVVRSKGSADFTGTTCAADAEKIQCESLKAEKTTSFKGTEIVNGDSCSSRGVSA